MAEAAILHYPNHAAPPQGIWWFDGSGRLGKFYTDKDMQKLGEGVMAPVAYQADAVDVEDFFDRLSSASPRPDLWEVVTLTGMTGPEYLRFEAKRYAKSA